MIFTISQYHNITISQYHIVSKYNILRQIISLPPPHAHNEIADDAVEARLL